MKKISLTRGMVAIVDDEDFDKLNKIKWNAHKNEQIFYASSGRGTTMIKMHHYIIGKPPKGKVTDHIDGNGLNNQKENLRHVSNRINTINTNKIKKTSRFPGVHFFNRKDRPSNNYPWCAEIRINGKSKHLGYFKTEEEAFEIYKKTVMSLSGEVVSPRCPICGGGHNIGNPCPGREKRFHAGGEKD